MLDSREHGLVREGPVVRSLDFDEASKLLASVDLRIGEWGQICDPTGRPYASSQWIHQAAPNAALPLYCFSHQILAWLKSGSWILVQVDDSTNLAEDEEFLIARLLNGPQAHGVLRDSRSLLFEFAEPRELQERLLLGDLLHMMLLFGAHGQVVSAGSAAGQHLSLQDGFVYFISKDGSDISRAREILKQLATTPLLRPDVSATD